MKKLSITLMMLCCAIVGNAQVTDEISAILQVGDNAQIFDGADALKEALEAAPATGGVITLSSGTFNAAPITKSVSIYGAGWVTEASNPPTGEADNSLKPTIVTGSNWTITLDEGVTGGIHLEGIKVNASGNQSFYVFTAIDGLDILKCYFDKGIAFEKQNDHVVITQCYIAGAIANGHDVLVQNCYSNLNYAAPFSDASNIVFNHCILVNGHNYNSINNKFRCINSFVWTEYNYKAQVYQYCVFGRSNLDGFEGSSNDWLNVKDNSNIFTDQNNSAYSDTRTFQLSDEAKATYIGNDGTEVGVNGGNYPWNKTPHTPLVTNLKVTTDGTNLKVTYNAETR